MKAKAEVDEPTVQLSVKVAGKNNSRMDSTVAGCVTSRPVKQTISSWQYLETLLPKI